MRVEDARRFLEQQLADMRARRDEELLADPFQIEYLLLFSPHEVTRLINTFLVG